MSHRKMFASGLVSTGAAILLITGSVLSLPAFAELPYALIPVEYGVQLKAPDGHVVFEYVTKKPEKIGLTSPSAAYFHPVKTPSGETVTNVAPDDHPHHRGIFLGFLESEFHTPAELSKTPWGHPVRLFDIQRGDFWSWGMYAPRDGRMIQNRDIKLAIADAKRAQLVVHNDWLIENRRLLEETDKITVTERDGVYVIDLAYRLAPIVDYVLKQQAFGGFAVQGQKAGDHYYSTASGKVTLQSPYYSAPDLDWPSEPWYDYTIHLASDGKVVGVWRSGSSTEPTDPLA